MLASVINPKNKWHVLAQTLQHTSEAILVVDASRRIIFANNAYTAKTGFAEGELLDHVFQFTSWGRYNKDFYATLWASAEASGTWQGQVCVRHKNGKRTEEVISITAIVDGTTTAVHFSVIFHHDNKRADVALNLSSQKKDAEADPIVPKGKRYAPEQDIVGSSAIMKKMFRGIRKLAGVDAPVLITGESGTGKEKAAISIHRCCNRAGHPFIAVNCGALPSSLIQSELFGYERGAFTGAARRKLGRIEMAAGGTLFLDEVGDFPLELQVVLLRFLQEKTIDRVGGGNQVQVDVRVIAATHVNLEQAVREGRFREDLYYRLSVLHLPVPPLRDRDGDVDLLAEYCWQQFLKEKSIQAEGFSKEALSAMNQHLWPGNVRELINRTRRAMIMADKRLIVPADLGLERRAVRHTGATLEQAREASEKQALQLALQHTKGNISLAAKRLGVSRVCVYRLIKKYEIPAI